MSKAAPYLIYKESQGTWRRLGIFMVRYKVCDNNLKSGQGLDHDVFEIDGAAGVVALQSQGAA